MTTAEDRYQYQPTYIKIYRWLKWKPLYLLKATWHLIWWWSTDGKMSLEARGWFLNRWEYAKFLWRLHSGEADMKMRHYYTMEEVIENLKQKGLK